MLQIIQLIQVVSHLQLNYFHCLVQRNFINFLRIKAKIALALLLFGFSYTQFAIAQVPSAKTIAITQIAAHSSLDKVRQGIIDELSAQGYQEGKTARLLFANAQGNLALAQQIAQQFVSQRPDIIIAIATPSAQAAVNAAQKTSIPIVFASITDPVQAKLIPNLQHPGGNVTGTLNTSPVAKQLVLIRQIMPQLKNLGIVLNYAEANSVQVLQQIKQAGLPLQISVKTAAATSSAEVLTASASLVGQVDAILLLQDNTVAAALPTLLNVCNQHQVPVFTTYLDAVKLGAVAGLAFDEYAIGRQTGKMAVKILRGASPAALPAEQPKEIELAVNEEAAKKNHLILPAQLIQQSKQIYPQTISKEDK